MWGASLGLELGCGFQSVSAPQGSPWVFRHTVFVPYELLLPVHRLLANSQDLSSCTGLRAKVIAKNITQLDFRRAEASVPADKAMILKAIEDLDGGLERVEWTVKHLVTDFEPGAQDRTCLHTYSARFCRENVAFRAMGARGCYRGCSRSWAAAARSFLYASHRAEHPITGEALSLSPSGGNFSTHA